MPRSQPRPNPISWRNPLATAVGFDDAESAGVATSDKANPLEAKLTAARPSTTALIVHWGNPEPTVRLVHDLGELAGIDEVVVVANDLRTCPLELANSATWIVPPRNLGFAGGFDYGFRSRPGSDFYLLLNNDVEIDEACIDECRHVLGDPSIGVVAPVLVNSDGIQSAVGRMSVPLFKGTTLNYPSSDRTCDAEWVTGAVMFIRARCYEQVGFNLGYFLIWEDVDFCFRARNKGWRVAVASRAWAWHRGGATIPMVGGHYYSMRNRIWFSRRWGTRLQASLVWLWLAAVLTPKILLGDSLKRRGFKRSLLALHALVDGLKSLPGEDIVPIGEPYPAIWSSWR
jgi:N-acetylglucosaminyl-diphospho-decaprenol L-rhamnosyltransferase